MVPEQAHTRESHSHEVWPGGTTADREAETILTSSGTTLCTILQQKVNSGLLLQSTSHPESTCDPSDTSHLDTHAPTTRSRAVSVKSSLADSDLQAALAKSQRGITELKDTMVKKFEDKPDNPRLGFCDFLKVEVVQLRSDSMLNFNKRHSTY